MFELRGNWDHADTFSLLMSELAYKVRPRKKILVKMLPISGDYHNPAGLNLISHKKHWQFDFRRAEVISFDPAIAWRVPELMLGDTVIIKGDAGFCLDGDILDEEDRYENPLKGESHRFMRWKEILAIEEKEAILE